MVINIGAFASKDICEGLIKCADIRSKTLDRCYAIEGYADLPIETKNEIYDNVRKEIESEVQNV